MQPGSAYVIQTILPCMLRLIRMQQAGIQSAAQQQAVPQATGLPAVKIVSQNRQRIGLAAEKTLRSAPRSGGVRGSQAQAKILRCKLVQSSRKAAHSQKILTPQQKRSHMSYLKKSPLSCQLMLQRQAFIKILQLPKTIAHAAHVGNTALGGNMAFRQRSRLAESFLAVKEQGIDPGKLARAFQPVAH